MAKSTPITLIDNALMAPHDVMDFDGNNALSDYSWSAIFNNTVHKPYFKVGALTLALTALWTQSASDIAWAASSLTATTVLITIRDYSDVLTDQLKQRMGVIDVNDSNDPIYINTQVSKDMSMPEKAGTEFKTLRNKFLAKALAVSGMCGYSIATVEFEKNGGNPYALATFGAQATTYLLSQAYYVQRIIKQDWTISTAPSDHSSARKNEQTVTVRPDIVPEPT